MARKSKADKEVILPTMTRPELFDYIRDNHKLFTMAEMAENTGFSYQQIKVACEKEGYEAITLQGRVKEYIEHNMHLTLDEQATRLELSVESLKYHYKQLSYDHKMAGRGQRLNPDKTVREKAQRIIRELGSLPIEMLLGPIARKYSMEEQPLDTINKVRARLLPG